MRRAAIRKSPLRRSEPAPPAGEIHTLYIKMAASAPTEDREVMLEMLKYIHVNLPVFTKMGITVKIVKIRCQDLQNQEVMATMRARGISRLPALTTSTKVYIGYKEIRDLYERNIVKLRKSPTSDDDDDVLAKFYREELVQPKADDEDDVGVGSGDTEDMMNSYRKMLAQREKTDAARRPPTGRSSGGGDSAAAVPRRPAAPPPSVRPDNVSHRQAPSGDDSGEDVDNPQDDLMEKAYWARIGDEVS